jgi:saccharopine dehydrogenase-like NADP-dependent oxidoreductase
MAQHIFIIGAGRSTISLINYLLERADALDWHITVGDQSEALAQEKVAGHPRAKAIAFDVNDSIARVSAISKADLVISMLPAHMHIPVATDCIALGKHMVTASYVSKEMEALDAKAKAAGVVLMNEIGVDPGIDHLSAMKLLDELRDQGAEIIQFESFTGGLLAPESEGDNPWKYKFTWNPRNVVLAGAGGAVKFIQENKYKYIPYHQVFRRTEPLFIEGYGRFEGYSNRDSLRYRDVYGLSKIPTIYRGTLRRPGFCRAWDTFIKLGMTDDSYVIENSELLSHREFVNLFLAYSTTDSIELKFKHYLQIPQDSDLMEKMEWLGLFSTELVGLKNATPAQMLQAILEKKWNLQPEDRDMIAMIHKIGFVINGEKRMIESSMVTLGKNAQHTAMARTVGLPVAIATRLILEGKIHTPGVQMPISKEIYLPMLAELEKHDITFVEREVPYTPY